MPLQSKNMHSNWQNCTTKACGNRCCQQISTDCKMSGAEQCEQVYLFVNVPVQGMRKIAQMTFAVCSTKCYKSQTQCTLEHCIEQRKRNIVATNAHWEATWEALNWLVMCTLRRPGGACWQLVAVHATGWFVLCQYLKAAYFGITKTDSKRKGKHLLIWSFRASMNVAQNLHLQFVPNQESYARA